MSTTTSDTSDFSSLLTKLSIPQDFVRRDESITEPEVIVALETWRRNAYAALSELRVHLESRETLSLSEQAQVVVAVAGFDGEGSWVLPTTQALALGKSTQHHFCLCSYTVRRYIGCLEKFSPPSLALLEQILAQHAKPVFQSTPHPQLNMSTGRKLARSAGGVHAQQDYYEGQTWKSHPGIANVLSWCMRHMDVRRPSLTHTFFVETMS